MAAQVGAPQRVYAVLAPVAPERDSDSGAEDVVVQRFQPRDSFSFRVRLGLGRYAALAFAVLAFLSLSTAFLGGTRDAPLRTETEDEQAGVIEAKYKILAGSSASKGKDTNASEPRRAVLLQKLTNDHNLEWKRLQSHDTKKLEDMTVQELEVRWQASQMIQEATRVDTSSTTAAPSTTSLATTAPRTTAESTSVSSTDGAGKSLAETQGVEPSSRESSANLTTTATAKAKCALDTENCAQTGCCEGAGLQCYSKNSSFAKCRASCVVGLSLYDEDGGEWKCAEIGSRAPGAAAKCSAPGESCMDSTCCSRPGDTCFKKNANYASCKPSCEPGQPDQSDEDARPWSCERLGRTAPGAASWVGKTCSKLFEDCSKSRCCANPGMTCFAMNDYYAQCLPSCGGMGQCKVLGEKTPEFVDNRQKDVQPTSGKVAQWVEMCSGESDDCTKTKCCKQPGAKCYEKNEYWSQCKEDCTPGKNPADNNSVWSCDKVGPRSFGLARKGWPSLFCWSLVQADSYEAALVRKQAQAAAGIFACDGHAVVADGPLRVQGTTNLLANTKDMHVGVSSDGTAANAAQFMKAWQVVIEQGDFNYFDWTIKVDPDTLLLPSRLRDHLRPHTRTGANEDIHYVLNCNAYPNNPNFPMMYGSLEAFSRKAIRLYAVESWDKCVNSMKWKDWGEDVFMVSCMNAMGVGKINDFKIIGDNKCMGNGHGGADCSNPDFAAFHPFKDIDSWIGCYKAATGLVLDATDRDQAEMVQYAARRT